MTGQHTAYTKVSREILTRLKSDMEGRKFNNVAASRRSALVEWLGELLKNDQAEIDIGAIPPVVADALSYAFAGKMVSRERNGRGMNYYQVLQSYGQN